MVSIMEVCLYSWARVVEVCQFNWGIVVHPFDRRALYLVSKLLLKLRETWLQKLLASK